MFKKHSKTDILVLLNLNLLAFIATFIFKSSFLVSSILFLGIPSFFLIYKLSQFGFTTIYKILILATISGLLFGFCFDLIAGINHAWSLNNSHFGRIFGVVEISELIYFFLWILYIFLFYEYFIDKPPLRKIATKNTITALILGVLSFIGLSTVYLYEPMSLMIPHAYLTMCICVIVPLVSYSIFKTQLVKKSSIVIYYFIFVFLLFEFMNVYLGNRIVGESLFALDIGVNIPIEDLVFWGGFGGLVAVIYLEVCSETYPARYLP